MWVGITADVHLNSAQKGRLENFEGLIKTLKERNINILIVAGDLFDSGYEGYLELDRLAKRHGDLSLILLPGNHDATLTQAPFSAKNIRVYSTPTVEAIDGRTFLFLPFQNGKTMGEVIETSGLMGELDQKEWILISHGDFGRVKRDLNGNEQGYFPLTRADILQYNPRKVILGHIHSPSPLDSEVLYPGSPYPLDINETGQRRILIVDLANVAVRELYLEAPPLFLQKEIFLIPDSKEKEQIEDQLEEFFTLWEQRYKGREFYKKLHIRVSIGGLSSVRQGIDDFVRDLVKKRGGTLEKVDIDPLGFSEDEDRSSIARKVKGMVDRLDIRYESAEELRREILKKSYDMIYG